MANEKKDEFRNLGQKRKEWLESGHETKVINDYGINSFSMGEKKDRLVLVFDSATDINESVKKLRFKSENKESLPSFRPGQYITLTIKITSLFFSKPFVITSTPTDASEGIYEIMVKEDDDQVTKYLFNKLKPKEVIISSHPSGDFYYDRIRDTKNVIAIASSDEIFPIYSMANSLTDGSYHYKLIVFYYGEKDKDLLLKSELEKLKEKTSYLKVIYVLSNEEKEGAQKGYVSLNKIKKELENNEAFFISCKDSNLKYFEKELEPLNLPNKFIHYFKGPITCNLKSILSFNLTIYLYNEKYETKCYNNKTILQSILEMGIYIPSKCQNGTCGLCQSELLKGKVKIVNDNRLESEKKYAFIHPCVTYPLSDIELIIR